MKNKGWKNFEFFAKIVGWPLWKNALFGAKKIKFFIGKKWFFFISKISNSFLLNNFAEK